MLSAANHGGPSVPGMGRNRRQIAHRLAALLASVAEHFQTGERVHPPTCSKPHTSQTKSSPSPTWWIESQSRHVLRTRRRIFLRLLRESPELVSPDFNLSHQLVMTYILAL